jgi:hypothetical protein
MVAFTKSDPTAFSISTCSSPVQGSPPWFSKASTKPISFAVSDRIPKASMTLLKASDFVFSSVSKRFKPPPKIRDTGAPVCAATCIHAFVFFISS